VKGSPSTRIALKKEKKKREKKERKKKNKLKKTRILTYTRL